MPRALMPSSTRTSTTTRTVEIFGAAFEFGCPGCEFGRLIYTAPGYSEPDDDVSSDDVRTTRLSDGWIWYEEDR